MLSALLRPFQGNNSYDSAAADVERDIAPRPPLGEYRQHRHATADFTEADDDDEESNHGEQSRYPSGGRTQADEDGLAQSTGLLPMFSGGHLDSLPVYSMTHAIRIIVQARTETTLTWEQLKSPQVSQFLVKPMQQQIRTQHFSPGTLYALMANCLQFEKEGQLYLGNAGISSTRARVCELLAMKLLKEYTTRELIDALSYDFYPLQGISGSQTPLAAGSRPGPAALRTSTLEVAIRASAKHFLSHPLVVQQLEAIWNGAISFCPTSEQPQSLDNAPSAAGSSQSRRQSTVRTPLLSGQQPKEDPARFPSLPPGQRSVTLYDPRSASPFKLSRLRVPRYRHILSTCSLVILIGLFLGVLGQRSSKITSLELLFWFWSAGFMLDEIVGFNEQGFSLYIMSFWNIFDLGILLLLIVYYCMRIYGVFLLDPHKWNENAYDVLAASGILLLPRIFNVLDHNRYFSQLLIAFRLLAIDMIAVFVLILVCCSGFFVFFAFSKNAENPYELAYKIFQILMGFTPAAWEVWPSYNWMGKALMGLFLTICHFAVITMLITVLGNSFTSIASSAKQEYR
ncbi:Calcium channel YVC1 [Madurella mycetomatis]|uniref:Calcium channel YVC1 n=1 Tax=Madurella mycetomatis TaxID=100816 RepID=A0A175WE72_9PEZI|nr:Calcium channel YVC1 [Madurella mycetomatis]KXX81822.1 Calcium channel YVC1 [Madurella mycetomatis]